MFPWTVPKRAWRCGSILGWPWSRWLQIRGDRASSLPHRIISVLVGRRQSMEVKSASYVGDAKFLRKSFLNFTGVIPPVSAR